MADVRQRLSAAREARETAAAELEAAVVAAATDAVGVAEIARLSGYSRQGVYDVLRRYGFRAVEVEIPPKPQPPKTRRMFMPPGSTGRKPKGGGRP
jgi:hypothetical protein